MFRPTRWEYRIISSDVDRGVNFEKTVVLSQHAAESTEHLVTRILAYCLVAGEAEDIGFGPGVEAAEGPDLVANDLTGRMVLWVGCCGVSAELVRKVAQHNSDAHVHAFFIKQENFDGFEEKVGRWPKKPKNLTAWLLPVEAIDLLAGIEVLRQEWVLTVVGEHMYIEAPGVVTEGPIVCRSMGA